MEEIPVTVDAVEINSLFASRPDVIRAHLEVEPLTGMRQLTLIDPSTGDMWRIGGYVDGHEGRRPEIVDALHLLGPPIVPDGLAAWMGNDIVIKQLEYFADVIVVTVMRRTWWRLPLLCERPRRADAPLYFGTTLEGVPFVLDCDSGDRLYFESLDELVDDLRARACFPHDHPQLCFPWRMVARGAVARADDTGETSLREVVAELRRLLRAGTSR